MTANVGVSCKAKEHKDTKEIKEIIKDKELSKEVHKDKELKELVKDTKEFAKEIKESHKENLGDKRRPLRRLKSRSLTKPLVSIREPTNSPKESSAIRVALAAVAAVSCMGLPPSKPASPRWKHF